MLELEEFDFPLDESRIARYPSPERDGSRLMVLHRDRKTISTEPAFRNIIHHLRPGDHIFYNETRVSPRRVYLRGGKDGVRIHEAIFIEFIPDGGSPKGSWKCLLRNSKKVQPGDQLHSPSGKIVFFCLRKEENTTHLQASENIGEDFFEEEGNIPIPPYLKREAEELDKERYQTIFAKKTGSVASPTAGLHMTEDLRNKLMEKGVEFYPIHLEIGFGTFQPLTDDNFKEKKLHKERVHIERSTLLAHKKAGEEGKRRIALGTTSLRALESMRREVLPESQGAEDFITDTEIFLSPGDEIDTIDGLITNFHLPKSSLILLVAAFAGKKLTMEAYHKAVRENFRFFSYGDAMLII